MRLAIVLFAASFLRASGPLPGWVTDAVRQPVPPYPPRVTAVVVMREERLTVEADGKRTAVERGVIRLLQPRRQPLLVSRSYYTKNSVIRQFKAWAVAPDGKATELPKDAITDHALASGHIYTEGRVKSIEWGAGAAPGSLLAYEVVEEERTVFTQYYFDFQDEEPVLLSRFVLSMPAGWETKYAIFNGSTPEPAVSGNSWTWELRDLPPIESEDYGPGLHSLQPTLWLGYFPSAGNAAGLRPLKDWTAVSEWLTELVDSAGDATPAIRTQAAELTQGKTSEWERIRAVAEFTQKVNYVSVQTNLLRGGGYTPKPPQQVLERNYGDCKDKAALMRALLKEAGIESYVTSIFSGDRDFVRPEWPSPFMFNHDIIGVRVGADTQAPAIVDHPSLGRLLMFDPTSESTPLGDLPVEEQGSYALILAGGKGQLARMPLLPASANRIESSVKAVLAQNGKAEVALTRRFHGSSAARVRSLHRAEPKSLKESFETGLATRLGGIDLANVTGAEGGSPHEFTAGAQFSVLQFGRTMRSQLMVVRPGLLATSAEYGLPAKERKTPVRLRARVRSDQIEIALPAGLRPEELPQPVEISGRFGTYCAKWSENGGTLHFEQRLELHNSSTPAAEYEAVREFFSQVSAAQGSAVVLVAE